MSEASTAVFLSYASQDTEAAMRVAEALRAAGVEVWFDRNELRGGEAWDQKIRRQIKECALFMPLISANTEARAEGYFRLEWRLADQRTHLMGKSRAFLVPVCIDDTAEATADVPDSFLAVQSARVRDGQAQAEFVDQVRRLLSTEPRSRGRETPRGSREQGAGSRKRDPSGGSPEDGGRRSEVGDEAPVVPDYEMVRKVGSGAYGDVWLARGVTGIYRAVKVVWRERFEDAEPFEREFRGLKEFAAISLKVEGQMALLHIGRNDAAGFFYYVMELADDAQSGRTFSAGSYVPLTLKELKRRKGRVPAAEVIAIGAELAAALAALHARGLVHRDIKPSNAILVNGKAKLADIGLVAAAHEAKTFIGTSGYVPPEGPGAPSADVYALGRVLYELATGLDRDEFPRLPPGLDRLPDRAVLLELNEVLLRACAPAPGERYADAAALAADLSAMRSGGSLRRKRTVRRAAWAGLVIAALTGVAVAWNRWPVGEGSPGAQDARSRPAAAAVSVAVLPLAASASDRDAAVFSGGVHAELIATLARNPGLKVIARNSTLVAEGPGKSRGDIARALGVGHLVSGSVARTRGGLQLTLEVHAADSARALWRGTFDCTAADVLRIQPELARQVAQALGAPPSPAGALPAADRPPDNIAAYELLAKGRNLLELDETSALEVAPLLEEAVRLDPGSFLAWAELSSLHAQIFFLGLDRSETRRSRAREAVEIAARLSAGSPEVILAQGNFFYWCLRDYSRAIGYYRRLLEIQPSSAKAYALLGAIDRRQGRWGDAIANLRRGVDLDPLDVQMAHNLLEILSALRRYPEALAVSRRLAELFPGKNYEKFEVADMEFLATGSTREADRLLANFVPEPGREDEKEHWERMWAINRGDYATAVRLESNHPFLERAGFIDGKEGQEVDAATWLYFAGRVDEARKRAAMAKPVYLERIQREPENPGVIAQLATIAMIEGHDEDALRYARRVLDVGLERGDTQAGPRLQGFHASVLAWTGATERALDELERLLKIPYGGNVHVLRRRQLGWLKLHGHPRFEAILNDPANNAPFDLATGRPTQMPPVGDPSSRIGSAGESSQAANSIAVLPFESRGSDEEGRYIADGLHEDVVTNFAGIPDMKVASRSSALRYRGTAKSPREIGGELGVDYLLTGSLRREGSQVRVTAELVDARTERQVWAKSFDRELSNVLALQRDLAAEIVPALHLVLRPEETLALTRGPTSSARAYDLFLQARALRGSGFYEDSAKRVTAHGLLRRAVAEDPTFYRAWAELAQLNVDWYMADPETNRMERLAGADEAITTARKVAPDAPEVRLAAGRVRHYLYRDYAAALHLYRGIVESHPNYPDVRVPLALLYRRLGRWSEALATLREAVRREPGDLMARGSLIMTLIWTRRYAEIDTLLQNRPAEVGESLEVAYGEAVAELRRHGRAEAFNRRLAQMTAEQLEQPSVVRFRLRWAHHTNDAATVAELISRHGLPPDELDVGWALLQADRPDLLAAVLAPIKARFDRLVADSPEDAMVWRELAKYHAMRGERDAARAAVRRARELFDESSDAVNGPQHSVELATVLAWIGEKDAALSELERLIKLPATVHVFMLRRYADWQPLRDEPRFQALLNDPANLEPLVRDP